MMNDPGLNIPRGTGQRQPPRHGRRAARRGVDNNQRFATMRLSAEDADLGSSLSDVEARERQRLVQRQQHRGSRRDDIATKAFHAGQDVIRGHAPNHHLEPTLGYQVRFQHGVQGNSRDFPSISRQHWAHNRCETAQVQVDPDAIAAERRASMAATAAPPRQSTPLAGQTQLISRGSLHTPSVPVSAPHTYTPTRVLDCSALLVISRPFSDRLLVVAGSHEVLRAESVGRGEVVSPQASCSSVCL